MQAICALEVRAASRPVVPLRQPSRMGVSRGQPGRGPVRRSQVLVYLVHWHAHPVGGDADVGDRWERRVLRAVVGLPRQRSRRAGPARLPPVSAATTSTANCSLRLSRLRHAYSGRNRSRISSRATGFGNAGGQGPLCWLSRREVLERTASAHEFVEHALDGAERDRKMTLSSFEMH